jgi:Mg2+ and Co2+ transporter CorA
MNAYELADIVDKWAYKESAEYLTDAANMLRHQADYIKHLEEGLESSINLNKAQAERQEK